jgi:hypothetical protein
MRSDWRKIYKKELSNSSIVYSNFGQINKNELRNIFETHKGNTSFRLVSSFEEG